MAFLDYDGLIRYNNKANGKLALRADAIIRTAEGNIASFDDGGDGLNIKSLIVNIDPVQSGSGDPSPSNVRAISGWDEVNVNVSGKNLLSDEVHYLAIDGATGELLSNNARYALVLSNPKVGTKYTISRSAVGSSTYYYYGFYSELTVGQIPIVYHDMGVSTSYTVTAPEGANYLVIFYGAALSPNPQAEAGETATDYVPYEGETKSIALPQTVYGGVLDVVSGKLVVDRARVDIPTLTWSRTSSYSRGVFYCSIANGMNGHTGTLPKLVADCFKTTESTSPSGIASQGNNLITLTGSSGNQFLITADDYSTVEAFITAMSGHYFVYELATPTTIQLTPTEVKSLLGDNNIWADAGTVEVEYRADTTSIINKILSAIAELA